MGNGAITRVALVVRDYDEAIAFFTETLRFALVEDTDLGNGKRWVVVAPRGDGGTALLLAKAVNAEQQSRIGDQTGGRVFLFLHTDDFRGDYEHMRARGVRFVAEPRREPYGTVVVFLDLYGNKWDMIEPHAAVGESVPEATPTIARQESGMKISARNVLKGKVKKLVPGAVNTEVTVELPGGTEVVSVITKSSAEGLGLKVGTDVHAVIKASNVMIAID